MLLINMSMMSRREVAIVAAIPPNEGGAYQRPR